MDLHHRKRAVAVCLFLSWWTTTSAYSILLPTHSAKAQVAGDLLLDDIAIQNPPRFEGAEFQIDLPDGTRCSTQQGTPPHLSFYGGTSRRGDSRNIYNTINSDQISNTNSSGNGMAAGAIVTIPLGSRTKKNCDKSYELHLLTKKLELANVLFEQGLIDESEIAGLIMQAKKLLNVDLQSQTKGQQNHLSTISNPPQLNP